MDRPTIKTKHGPEKIIQDRLLRFLSLRGWFTLSTHGNMFQSGLPDIYATHKMYGVRWIEVKNPVSYSFTNAQLETFPKLTCNGTGIWILVDDTENEYQKLWRPANWIFYLHRLNKDRCPDGPRP